MFARALVICEVVYAELATLYHNQAELQFFLTETRIHLQHSSENSLWSASRAWARYTKNRSKEIQCSNCGKKYNVVCTCQSNITSRQHIVSDFLIGAHAQLQADTLLTRDRGFYKTYFPELHLNQV